MFSFTAHVLEPFQSNNKDNASGDAPPDDDEYDLLNDETFGDIQEDFDWDEATTGAAIDDVEGETGSSKLELKVNELVLDDEPDDPAIITVHSKRIPTRPADEILKDIYGPQSPPAYVTNIDSLLHPSHDIWGSPGQFSYIAPTVPSAVGLGHSDTAREAYLGTSIEKNAGFPLAPSLTGRTDGSTESPPVSMPKNAMTVEELERQLSFDAPVAPTPPRSAPGLPYNGRTDSSQILHQDSPYHPALPPGITPGFHSGSPSSPHRNMPHSTGAAHRIQLLQHDSPMSPNGAPVHHMQRNIRHADPTMNRGTRPVTILQRHAPVAETQSDNAFGNHPLYRGMPGPGTPPRGSMPIYNDGFNSYNGRHPPVHRMPAPAPLLRLPYGNNRSQIRPRMMLQNHNMMNNQHMSPNYQQQQYMMQQHHQMQQQHMMGPPRDEYAGLLTGREKDWLIKIQMIQLHTDDPYTDDYYFTIYNIEKAENSDEESGRKSSKGELILPAMAKLETRQYTPMQFEGSLGRLTSSSVHKPRQVLDVGDKSDQLSHTVVETKKYRQSLLTAEKAYQLILDIDEILKKIPSVPDEQRTELQTKYEDKLVRLQVMIQESWLPLLNVRKGRSLILRTLPLLDKEVSKVLLEKLLLVITTVTKKELADPVEMKSIRCLNGVISTCDMMSLIRLSKLITPSLKSFIKTLLGCHLLVMMIRQAEQIYAAFVEVPEELTRTWNEFMDEFLIRLDGLKSPPKLRHVSMSVYDHLSKRPHSDQALLKVESWFNRPPV